MTTTKIARLTFFNVRALDRMSELKLIPSPTDFGPKGNRTYDTSPAELLRMIRAGRTAAGLDTTDVVSSHAVTRKLEDWCSTVELTAGRTNPGESARTVGHVTVTFA